MRPVENWREYLRRRPEMIVGPALVAWLLVNGLPITFGRPFLVSLLQTATFRGNAGPLFPVTYGCAVALFGLALVVLTELKWPRRLLVALAFPFAFIQVYEIPYVLMGWHEWPQEYAWAVWPIVLLLNGSWLALGVSTFPFWRLGPKGAVLLAAVVTTLVIWWVWYWPQIYPDQPPLNPEGSGYMVSKVATAMLFAVLLWEGRGRPRSESHPPPSDRRGETTLPPDLRVASG